MAIFNKFSDGMKWAFRPGYKSWVLGRHEAAAWDAAINGFALWVESYDQRQGYFADESEWAASEALRYLEEFPNPYRPKD